MNTITILNYTIPDSQIVSGNIILNNSMICDELTADEATFEINYEGSALAPGYLYSSEGEQLYSNSGVALMALMEQEYALSLDEIPYGTPLVYSHDENVIAKLYVKSVEQIGEYRWKITAQSAVGLLINQEHNGGIYSVAAGDTIGSVIDEIMDGLGIDYTVDEEIADDYVAGHLPVASCRDNLQQLCFAFGISIMKDDSGDLLFGYNKPEEAEEEIASDRIYMGGNKVYLSPASKVTVYEHAFYSIPSRTPIIVFDNTSETTADNLKIIFENPIIVSTIEVTGTITISESNPNYCIVSGAGTIEAVEYTHTMKVLDQDTGVTTAETKEIVYKDATLVNALNSEYCLKRVAAFYSQANEVAYDIVVENERTGELVSYPVPFAEETKAGLIKQMDITLSSTLKAATRFTEDWMPNYLGNNYTEYEIVTEGQSWTADRDGTVRIFLVSGGTGGNPGNSGTYYRSARPGEGGAGGSGGTGGKVYVLEIEVTEGDTYTISIGDGGAGSTEGGATTIVVNGTTYSSANGTVPSDGLINAFTGDVYCQTGDTGLAGADGGYGGGDEDDGSAGNSITYNGVTYSGGSGGRYRHTSGCYLGGGGGGGAGYGSNGGNGGRGGVGSNFCIGGEGGAGGSSTLIPDQATGLGQGGTGGFGGGGAGGGGEAYDSTGELDYEENGNFWGASVGSGGAGGQGGPGFVMIYK